MNEVLLPLVLREEQIMNNQQTVANIGIGLISGYIGTRLMEPVGAKLYELKSEENRKQEDSVRLGEPYTMRLKRLPPRSVYS